MGVHVEEEWRYKKGRSERASRSAFAYKINSRIKAKGGQPTISYGYSTRAPYSREVIVKITAGATRRKGIGNALQYISKNWQLELTDRHGGKYRSKEEIKEAVQILQGNVKRLDEAKGLKLTHNMVFSAPKIAEVKEADVLRATAKVLREKYPNNYFVMAYHEETKNSHVHVVLNIHQDTGERINIRKGDLRDLRGGFAATLADYGYDVRATRKYGYKHKEFEELSLRENRNVYEVVEFGTESYKIDKRNSENNYLIYKTSNGKEVTIWGKELLGEVRRNDIKKGDLVKIRKTGHVAVKVPVYGDEEGRILSWRVAKRNCWQIERASNNFTFSEAYNAPQEIQLDDLKQFAKQYKQKEKFEDEKRIFLGLSSEEELRLKPELRQKLPEQKFRF